MEMLSGYINSKELGYVREDRVRWAVETGLLSEKDGEYYLTATAMSKYDNFYRWITGNCETLYKRQFTSTEAPAIKKSKSDLVDDLFSSF